MQKSNDLIIVMDIKEEKQNLIDWISKLEDESIIDEIKFLRDNYTNGKDWWSDLSEEEKKGIEEGLRDIEEGRIFTYEQVKDEVKKWIMKSDSQKDP